MITERLLLPLQMEVVVWREVKEFSCVIDEQKEGGWNAYFANCNILVINCWMFRSASV